MPGVTLHAKAGPAQEFGQVRVDSGPVVIPELASRLSAGQVGQAVLISRSAWPRVGQAARCFRPRAIETTRHLRASGLPARHHFHVADAPLARRARPRGRGNEAPAKPGFALRIAPPSSCGSPLQVRAAGDRGGFALVAPTLSIQTSQGHHRSGDQDDLHIGAVLLGKPAPARLRLLLRQRVRPIRAQQLTGPRSGQPNGRDRREAPRSPHRASAHTRAGPPRLAVRRPRLAPPCRHLRPLIH